MYIIISIPKEESRRTAYYSRTTKNILPFVYEKRKATRFDISDYDSIVSTIYCLSLTFGVPIKLKVVNE